MKAYIVVFHPGYYKGASSREEALRRVIENLKQVIEYVEAEKANNLWLGPETMGRKKQVGSLDEVIEISRNLKHVKPVIDWAHLYARHQGGLITDKDDVVKIIDKIEKELGTYAVKPLHSHFSKIEYSRGGEIRHHPLSAEKYGPVFNHVCRGLLETGVEAVIISESPLLEEDALVMQRICREQQESRLYDSKKE